MKVSALRLPRCSTEDQGAVEAVPTVSPQDTPMRTKSLQREAVPKPKIPEQQRQELLQQDPQAFSVQGNPMAFKSPKEAPLPDRSLHRKKQGVEINNKVQLKLKLWRQNHQTLR